MWFSQEISQNDENLSNLRLLANIPVMLTISGYILLGIGLLVACSLLLFKQDKMLRKFMMSGNNQIICCGITIKSN